MRKKEDQQYNVYSYRDLEEERAYQFTWTTIAWKILRPFLIGLLSLAIVMLLCFTVFQKVQNSFFSPVDSSDESEIQFTVESGNSLNKIAVRLEEANLIKNHSVFKYYCDFAGMSQKMQTGTYQLSRGMNMFEIADTLTTGTGESNTMNITVIPGETIEVIAEKLKKAGLLTDTSEFLNICRTGDGVSDFELIDEVLQSDSSQSRRYLLEGYLAPNTYEVYKSAKSIDIIRKLLSQTDSVMVSEWRDRAEELSMSVDEVLTLASMIEKEAKQDDFSKVSAVFHNRLKKNMPLESDPTIHYITGERRMVLRASDLAADSPYNTYRNKGLPPGPICNPSPAAIFAALYPEESYLSEGYLYFCCKSPESGELVFNRTLEEHEKAVEEYSSLWQAYDEERGY